MSLPKPLPAPTGYAICTTMRSGSTWLAELLSCTGKLGHPSEYFTTPFQRRIRNPDYPENRRAQIDYVLEHGRTPNGVYGFKIYPLQLEAISRRWNWTELFPNLQFIHWRRSDLLGQAISQCRALQTLQWRSTLNTQVTPQYDGDAIFDSMRRTLLANARWDLFFARNGIDPLRLTYEDALSGPQTTVSAVARLVGLATPLVAAPDKIEIAIQRDATTDEWRNRFLNEFADRNVIDEV